MPLGAAWWASGWSAARFTHVFTGATLTLMSNSVVWDSWAIQSVTQLWQPPFGYRQAGENGRERGRLYCRETITGQEINIGQLEYLPPSGIAPAPSSLTPAAANGDLDPTRWLDWPYYDSPCHFSGAIWLNIVFSSRRSGLWALRHFQPHAYKGTVAEVLACIALHRKVPVAFIDTVEFDNSYDGQIYDYGSSAQWPVVAYARETGKSIGQTMKDISRHCWDGLGFNMRGQLALFSRTRPRGVTGSTLDGMKAIRWSWSDDYLYNKVTAQHGQASKVWGDYQWPTTAISAIAPEKDNPDNTYETAWEPGLSSDSGGKWSTTLTDAISVALFGKVIDFGGGESIRVTIGGVEQDLAGVRFPYFLEYQRRDAVLQGWLDRESGLRREVRVEQDLRGLDFDIGHRITDLAITGDGQTIPDVRCIKKKIDFRTLTVTSELLEELA